MILLDRLGVDGAFDDQELLRPIRSSVIFIHHGGWDKGILAAVDEEHGLGVFL